MSFFLFLLLVSFSLRLRFDSFSTDFSPFCHPPNWCWIAFCLVAHLLALPLLLVAGTQTDSLSSSRFFIHLTLVLRSAVEKQKERHWLTHRPDRAKETKRDFYSICKYYREAVASSRRAVQRNTNTEKDPVKEQHNNNSDQIMAVFLILWLRL